MAVISLSPTGKETRRRALLELERRFGENRTEVLNGTSVVKSPHDLVYLVYMGLDLRLCTCSHLVKKEDALVKDAIVEAYLVYGMNVFEYEHAEKQRILENQTDETAVQQVQGGSRKKCRREEERRTMRLVVFSGAPVDDDCGFRDEETAEASLEEEMEQMSPEEQLEAAREARVLELRKETALPFIEYRNYNRIDLTTNRGWDQYLPKAPAAQSPAPVIATVPAVVAVALNVAAGEPGQPTLVGFFAPRTATTSPAAVAPALPTTAVGLNEPPAAQYDLMTDLLDADMFKVYSDILKSENLRIQQRKPAKFGY